MNQLETFLQQPLPTAEAAAFFIRLKGEKTASPKVLEQLNELSEEERAEALKLASALPPPSAIGHVKKANASMGYSGMAAQLPPTGKGQNMAPPPPAALPATALGMNAGPKLAAKVTPHEVGTARGEANTAAHFERESHRHGERAGGTLGRIAGLAAGAASAHHLGKGNPMASIAGAALGQHVGAGIGRSAGKAHDEHAYHKKHASAFKLALEAQGMPAGPQGQQAQPQPGQQNLQAQPGVEPQLTPEMQEYLATEQQADSQAMTAELEHARQALSAAMQAQQAAETKAQQLETKQQMTDSQIEQYQAQVADATSKAMGAQDEVLQNQQAAAAMRIAYQQLRGQLLQSASIDPPSLSGNDAALAAASTAAGPQSGPGPQAGPAGQAPNPGTPGTVAPEGDAQVSQPIQPNEPMFGNASPTTSASQKEPADGSSGRSPGKEVLSSARLLPFVGAEKAAALRDLLSNTVSEALPHLKAIAPHAAIGGALGGGLGFAESQMSNEPMRKKVQELEAKGDNRSIGDAMSLALSRGRLTLGEHAAKHPVASTALGALMGATTGARSGPGFVDALKSIKDDAGGIVSDLKNIRGK